MTVSDSIGAWRVPPEGRMESKRWASDLREGVEPGAGLAAACEWAADRTSSAAAQSDDHQEGEGEDKQEAALHAGFGLRILKVWQN